MTRDGAGVTDDQDHLEDGQEPAPVPDWDARRLFPQERIQKYVAVSLAGPDTNYDEVVVPVEDGHTEEQVRESALAYLQARRRVLKAWLGADLNAEQLKRLRDAIISGAAKYAALQVVRIISERFGDQGLQALYGPVIEDLALTELDVLTTLGIDPGALDWDSPEVLANLSESDTAKLVQANARLSVALDRALKAATAHLESLMREQPALAEALDSSIRNMEYDAVTAVLMDFEEEYGDSILEMGEDEYHRLFRSLLDKEYDTRRGHLTDVAAHTTAQYTLEHLKAGSLPLAELLQIVGRIQAQKPGKTPQIDQSLTADNLPVPSNQIVNLMLQGVWRAGPDWETNAFWSYNDTHRTARAQHQPQKGGMITLDVQHGLTDPQEALVHVDKYLRNLSTETADIALLFLTKLGQAKTPLGSDPIQITAAEIRHAKGLQGLRGKKRQEFDDRVADHVSRLAQLSFNMSSIHVKDPDHEGKGSAWKAVSWSGDRLFDIVTIKEEQSGLYKGEAGAAVTYTWSIRPGQWAYYFLNPEARRWITNMARGLFELSHREDRKVEQLAKKIGQIISLDSWKPSKGQPITYKHRTLLEKIGESPANSSRPTRLVDQLLAALSVLDETQDFPYRVAHLPQQEQRTRGWVNRFLEETVTFVPRNQEALPEPRPARKTKKAASKDLVPEDLGQRIRDHREAQHLNQETAARFIGISRRYLSDIENGKRVPSQKVVLAALTWLKE